MAREMSLIVNPSLGMYQKSGFSQQQQQNCTEAMVQNQQLTKSTFWSAVPATLPCFWRKLCVLKTKIVGIYGEGPWDIMFQHGMWVLAHPQRRKDANEI